MIGLMKKMKMSGKTMNKTFKEFYESQMAFQELVIEKYGYANEEITSIPCDNIYAASYHIQAMAEEFGELVKSDKRWKNLRNEHYDKENKLEELSDCFITLMNIAMFSGISADEMAKSLDEKIKVNMKRISKK